MNQQKKIEEILKRLDEIFLEPEFSLSLENIELISVYAKLYYVRRDIQDILGRVIVKEYEKQKGEKN
jgi:hypothetical protein